MRRFSWHEIGITSSLAGAGILLISLVLSTGGYSSLSFMQNINHREIVISEGEVIPEKRSSYTGPFGSSSYVSEKSYVEGRIAIPLKYPLSLSVLLILSGLGLVLLGKKKNDPAGHA